MESEDERLPVRKRGREMKSEDLSHCNGRKDDVESGDDKSLAEDSEEEMESENENLTVRKSQRDMESDEEFHVKKRIEFVGEEMYFKERDKEQDLADISKGMDDLHEPSCMDKILMYLEELRDEDYIFIELLVQRLNSESITWHQPWYQQSNSLSRPLKDTKNENHSESFRTDTICKAEHDKIQENWQEFMEVYKVPDKLICLARWRNKDKSRLPNTPEEQARRFVISYLARGLQRTTYQVFRHVMTYFGGSVKGAYSLTEEKIMQVCFMHHPNHAVTLLSVVLSREPRGIYKRLEQMFNGKPEKKKIKWTVPLATRFLRLLMKYTHLPLEELKNRTIDKTVWLKLEKKFNHLYFYLQNFWYRSLHVQIFAKENFKINKLRKQVYKMLKSSSYEVWTDIRWKDLVKHFPDGLTHRFLYSICQGVVKTIPGYLHKPLSDIAENALDRLRKHRYRKRRLKRLELNENGELEIVKYERTGSQTNV